MDCFFEEFLVKTCASHGVLRAEGYKSAVHQSNMVSVQYWYQFWKHCYQSYSDIFPSSHMSLENCFVLILLNLLTKHKYWSNLPHTLELLPKLELLHQYQANTWILRLLDSSSRRVLPMYSPLNLSRVIRELASFFSTKTRYHPSLVYIVCLFF